MRGTNERPEGLHYAADFLDAEEHERALVAVAAVELHEVHMRGQTARRTVRHFGFDYGYESWSLTPSEPLPADLEWLRERCATLADVPAGDLAQILVTRYPPGAGIGWHRDAPMFGASVVGVSLAAPCVMRFQRKVGDERRVYEVELAPGSAYVLGGHARSAWQHSIPAVDGERYSVTFRTLRNPARWSRPALDV